MFVGEWMGRLVEHGNVNKETKEKHIIRCSNLRKECGCSHYSSRYLHIMCSRAAITATMQLNISVYQIMHMIFK